MSVQRILDECIVLRLSRLRRVLGQRQDMALRQVGITGPQLVLLTHLHEQEEVRAVDLCKELRIEKSTMSRNLKRLLAAGLISLGPPRGRNGRTVVATVDGRKKVQEAFPIWEANQISLFNLLKTEEREAVALLA